jgi:hypothetical protein
VHDLCILWVFEMWVSRINRANSDVKASISLQFDQLRLQL